jgi:MFS family permease
VAHPGERLLTPAFLALTFADLAYFTASGLLIGVTPFFVTGPLGAGEAGLGVALGAFSVTTLVLRPVVGRLADRSGRRRLLIAGAGLFAVLIATHSVATDLWMLIVIRLLLGAAEALFFVAGFAALADLAPPGRAGEALSWNSLALYLGIAVGPGLGQLLLAAGGFTAAWAGGTALALVASALAARIPETAQPAPEGAAAAPLVHRAVIRPGLGLFTGVAASAGFLAFVGLHAKSIGVEAWSAAALVYGAVVIGCRVAFARLPDRLPPLRLGAASLGLCTTGLAILAAVPGAAGLLAGTAILAIGIAFLTPAIFAAIFGIVPAHERGAAAGTATVFIDLGFGGGPLLLGFVAADAGIPAAFAVAAALTAAGGVLLLSRRAARTTPIPPKGTKPLR